MANLSRQYRPSKFQDIFGQKNIVETLRKEVEQGKLGHAYLFSGPRGVGKTTAARIFGKAINCLAQSHGEPCLQCKSCQKIAAGNCIDIIEMDAASHTGVDNVRESIVEHVRFVPVELKYKVYIIDEAHMLSNSAWNALLKTVEEPPEHAIFIFATTEKHKVPATIVSRCQRFDFKKVSNSEIISRLQILSENEKCTVESKVLNDIALKSEGCLRDAENILGQLFSLGEKQITSEIASLIIPASNLPFALNLLHVLSQRNVEKALKEVQRLEEDGVSLVPLFEDLLTTVRELIVYKASKDITVLSFDNTSEKIVNDLCGIFDHQELLNISLLLMERRKDAKQGLDPRFALEMASVAIAIAATKNNISTPGSTIAPNQVLQKTEDVQSKKDDTKTEVIKTIEVNNTTQKEKALNQTETGQISSLTINDIVSKWPMVLNSLENHKSLVFILKLCRPKAIEGNKILVEFQYPYHQQTIIKNSKNKLIIEDAIRSVCGDSGLNIEGTVKTGSDQGPEEKKDMISNLISAFGGSLTS